VGSRAAIRRNKVLISRPPPRPATWLLERLGGVSDFDPLIGDLAEQFAQGRSRFWYWWQALGVLGLELVRMLRMHGLSFLAAVLAGCAVTRGWMACSAHAFAPLYATLPHVTGHPWTASALLWVAGMQLNALSNTVLTFATVWMVIRVHRAHQRAVLMVFVVALMAPRLPGLARPLIDATTHGHFTFALVPLIVPTGLQTAYTIAAGLWAIRTERFAEMDRWTRYFTVLAVVQSVFVAGIYHARLVGALPLARPEWAILDGVDIASIGYLGYLLWRPRAIWRPQLHTGESR
jgi:hypothetical protein